MTTVADLPDNPVIDGGATSASIHKNDLKHIKPKSRAFFLHKPYENDFVEAQKKATTKSR